MAFAAVTVVVVVVMSKGVVCVPDVLLLGRLNSGAQHIDTLTHCVLFYSSRARAPAAAIPFHPPRPPRFIIHSFKQIYVSSRAPAVHTITHYKHYWREFAQTSSIQQLDFVFLVTVPIGPILLSYLLGRTTIAVLSLVCLLSVLPAV